MVFSRSTQKTTQKILEELQKNPAQSRKELAMAVGLSEDGVKYHLGNLKRSGRIRRVGPDRGGRWEIVGTRADTKGGAP